MNALLLWFLIFYLTVAPGGRHSTVHYEFSDPKWRQQKVGVKRGSYHIYSHRWSLAMYKQKGQLALRVWSGSSCLQVGFSLLLPSSVSPGSSAAPCCLAAPGSGFPPAASSLHQLSPLLTLLSPLSIPSLTLVPWGTLWAGFYGDWQVPDQLCPDTCGLPLHRSPGPVLSWPMRESVGGRHPAAHRYANRLFYVYNVPY